MYCNISNKRKRTELTLDQKVKIINEADSGTTRAQLVNKYNLGKTTIGDILRKREEILENFKDLGSLAAKSCIRKREGEIRSLDEGIFQWFCQKRARAIPITDAKLQAKALRIKVLLLESLQNPNDSETIMKFRTVLENFKASNGWVQNFKKRYHIKSYSIQGERGQVSKENELACKSRVYEILKNLDPEDVYNCDETALFYKCLPNKSLDIIGNPQPGSKTSKERVTVMFCCNSTGNDRRKPLIIGKFKKPRCFRDRFDPNILGVAYKNNQKAWMTGVIFEEWLQDFDRSLNGRKIALVLDNAASHIDVDLENITLVFLDPNTTSVCQPLDQGIIKTFKTIYRSKILHTYIDADDEGRSVDINLKMGMEWIVESWKDMKITTFVNCFKKSGIMSNPHLAQDAIELNVELNVAEELQELEVQGLEFSTDELEQWFDFDKYYATEELVKSAVIVENILLDEEINTVQDNEEEALLPPRPTKTTAQGVTAIQETIDFLEDAFAKFRIDESFLQQFKRLHREVKRVYRMESIAQRKQIQLTSYIYD